MTKTLNLDKLVAKETRDLVLFGETYVVQEMSVETFIATTRIAESLEKETSFANQVETTIELIRKSVPTVSAETLMQMSLEQLRAISAFIRGANPDDIMAASNASEDKTAEGEQKNA